MTMKISFRSKFARISFLGVLPLVLAGSLLVSSCATEKRIFRPEDPVTDGAEAQSSRNAPNTQDDTDSKKKKALKLVPPSFKRTDPLPYVKGIEDPKPTPTYQPFLAPQDIHPGKPPETFNPTNPGVYPGNFIPN